MNKHVKEFLLRGLIFGGFGPILTAIVFFILQLCLKDGVVVNGFDLSMAIFSTYVIAFVHAGTSVFHQIDSWSPLKSASMQLFCLYAAYTIAYVVNSWIPFQLTVLLIYTVGFVAVYGAIWAIVYFVAKRTSDKMNSKI